MTAIVGLVHDGAVHLAGDSAGVGAHYSLTVRSDAKVFTNGPYVMGFTSSFRMGQLLRWAMKPPAVGCGYDLALGVLFALAKSRMAPERRLRTALEAAERFSAGVRGPFAYVTTGATT